MAAMTGQAAWARVGEAVLKRRVELGMTQQEAAAKAGIGSTTWLLLEKGKQASFRPLTLTAIARALEWQPDAITEMLGQRQARPAAKSGKLTAPKALTEGEVNFREDFDRRLSELEALVRELVSEIRRERPRPGDAPSTHASGQ